jgi:hypothetical protein
MQAKALRDFFVDGQDVPIVKAGTIVEVLPGTVTQIQIATGNQYEKILPDRVAFMAGEYILYATTGTDIEIIK